MVQHRVNLCIITEVARFGDGNRLSLHPNAKTISGTFQTAVKVPFEVADSAKLE